ncbi:PD-(D/E)XK nuclease domain-containing protein [Ruminococcus sp.]
MKQIDDKSYDLPFKADQRKIYKIGVSFDSEKRMLSDWKVIEA